MLCEPDSWLSLSSLLSQAEVCLLPCTGGCFPPYESDSCSISGRAAGVCNLNLLQQWGPPLMTQAWFWATTFRGCPHQVSVVFGGSFCVEGGGDG